MNASPSDDSAALLVHDIVALISLRPGALLRLPGSPCWGLALIGLGSAWLVALSIVGCARLAAHRRPWVHARTRPDLGQLAALLAARFPHAEPRESPGAFLYALDGRYGPCGRAVILAQASAERFPWIASGQPHALPAEATAAALDAARWQDEGAAAAPGAWGEEDLISGGALPPPQDPEPFFTALLAPWDRLLLTSADGRNRVRAALLGRCAQERQRLSVLRRSWPAECGGNPYDEPPWLADGKAQEEIERSLSAAVQRSGDAAGATATAAERQPSTLPALLPAADLAADAPGPP